VRDAGGIELSDDVRIGSVIAGYRVGGQLGRGGMGSVYEAEHAILGRKAALKTLLPELARDEDFRRRFIAESQMVAGLDHPSIIPIYDAGEQDGVVYILMRFVDGGDLQQLITDAPLEPARAVAILEQVAAALDAAHASGLVHRDVKPGNVLIESTGGRAYLTDFGLAKRLGAPGTTRVGFFVGTLDYAAPEQIRGDEVGPAADVYAFGCLVFETLTGRKPFARESDVAVMHAQLHDAAPVASDLRPALPAALDTVLAVALAKEVAGRFATCRELIEAVRQALGGQEPTLPEASRTLAHAIENLPPEPTPLIGRDEQLGAVRDLLRRPEVRLVTLTGPGGTGKTRLAIAVASRLAGGFDRAAFVDLAPLRDASLVGSAVARALGAEELGAEESPGTPPVENLARALGDGPALLVLDNFEQVLPAASLVHELLAALPALNVLVTSQAPLHLREEYEFPVPTLDAAPAVRLFVERALAVKPGFDAAGANAAAIDEICLRLDGLPLALELAAARVKLLSPPAILERLGQRLELLTGGAGDLPERQRTLRGAIEWSYNLLEEPEQALLARLGVFAGGCSLEAADAICLDGARLGAALDGLASLVDKSLVRQWDGADGEPRFGLLESIRAYAVERLEERGELDSARRRHAERFLQLAEEAEPELTRANQAVWLGRLDEEADNIRTALDWAVEAGEAELALRFAGALVRFWSTRGLMAEGRRRLASALELGGEIPPDTLARAHFAAGYAALGMGDFDEAKLAFERCLAAAVAADAEAPALAQLAWLAMAAGDSAAQELADRARALAAESGDKLTESGALGTLAELAAARGDVEAAIRLYERGLELRRGLGDNRLVANSLLALGRLDVLRGSLERATVLLEESRSLAGGVKDTWTISAALASLGAVRLFRGEAAAARDLLEEALRLARDRHDRRVAAEAVQGLAAVLALEGRGVDSARLFGAADAIRATTGAAASPFEAMESSRFLLPLRESLGAAFEAELMRGRSHTPDEAIALAFVAGSTPSA
jgi:predicted ATPase